MPTFKRLPLEYESGDVCTYEIKKDPLRPAVEPLVKARRTNEDLRTWLSIVPTVPNRPVSSFPLLRIIHLQYDTSPDSTAKVNRLFRIPLTESLCKDICRFWALPVDLSEWLAEVSDRIVSTVDMSGAGTASQRCYIFNFKSDLRDRNSALLIVKHTTDIPLSTAILATSASRPIDETDLTPFLNAAYKASTNPMTIPAALADVMITSEASITVEIDDKLCELERDKDTLRSSASVISTSTEQAERIAGILDEVRFLLGRSDRRLHRLKLLFSASSQYMQDLCNAMPNPKPQDDVEVTKRILEALNNNMRSDVEQLLLQVQNSNVRVQTLQQLIYNFMTTREAISGRLIAAVGMRDGAAMKALALLTMVFLPGTFIATIFSMPVISWPNPVLPIGGFALYWIVSVLLTIMVLGAWALWMHVNERRHSKRLDRSSKVT